MGADGHISIVRTDKLKEAFPDADELVGFLPTHYRHTLDGISYDHLYSGSHMADCWWDEKDWHLYDSEINKYNKRLRELCDWIQDNSTHWEVWT